MKKLISLLLSVIVVFSLAVNASAAGLMGDVNSDGEINSADALAILIYSVGESSDNFNEAVADLNEDGFINSSDALFVLEISVGIREIPEHKHDYSEWTVVKDATCAEEGIEERACSCGEKESQAIPRTDHIIVVDEAVEATCTTDGLTEGSHCSDCGEVIEAQKVISATGHNYEKEYVASDENTEQHILFTCTECGDSYTNPISKITATITKTSTSISITPSSIKYVIGYKVNASGGYGQLKYKYEVLASSTSSYVLYTQDFTTEPQISLQSNTSFENKVLKVTIKDECGNSEVFTVIMG